MKRLITLFFAFMLLCCGVSYAESGIDLSSLSPEELQQLISAAEIQLQLKNDDTMMQLAVQALTDYWRKEVYADPFFEDSNGYFEILSAQATFIKKDFATQVEFSSPADAMFENVYCVLDFVILSDYFGTAPYYWDAGINHCVVVYRDGTMSVARMSLFNTYRARTYSIDFSAIIERVEHFDVGDHNVYYLTAE